MGCDIHMITQIKKDGCWQYVPETPGTYNWRDYDVFAFLAQVRGYCKDGFIPKGLPEDLGETRYEQWEECNGEIHYSINFESIDYHSHSYLTLQEIDDKLRQNAPEEEPVRIPKRFLDTFYLHGGELPYGMQVMSRDDAAADIIWDSGLEYYPVLCRGRDELLEIARKYDVSPEHIRIVFAFDS